METFVADTHAIVWYAENDSRLGRRAREALDRAEEGTGLVLLSVMSLMEMDYLARKNRIDPNLPEKLVKSASADNAAFRIVDVDLSVYGKFLQIPPSEVPELPDRVIAATAMAHKARLVTKDGKLHTWRADLCVW